MGKILGLDGMPIDMGILDEEIAQPTLAGIRNAWYETIGSGITPHDLVRVLEESVRTTDPRPYLTLAEEMEEKDPHYFSVLGTRKLSIENLPVTIEPASDDAEDVKIADATREMMSLECVKSATPDLLDALGKGFSCSEIIWDKSQVPWVPQSIIHRDPRWFLFDIVDRATLRLKDEADPAYGIELPAYKFIVHKPKLKSGLPIRNGLARIIAFTWICKMYALKDWLAFAEVFGMPIRVGKYSTAATAKDVQVLRRAVANIGSDAAAVIPESMKIEFEAAGAANGGGQLYEMLCEYLDKQTSKAVLGQTMTTDEGQGRGKAQAIVHGDVRDDILNADGAQLAATLRRDLVMPFVALNFGPDKKCPKLSIHSDEPEDIVQLTDSLSKLVPLGLKVKQSEVRDKLRLSEPQPEDELLEAPAPPPMPPLAPSDTAGDPATGTPAMNRRGRNAQQTAAAIDPADRLTDQLEDASAGVQNAIVEPIRRLVMSASSYEEILAGIDTLYGEMDTEAHAALLRDALALAYLKGRVQTQPAS